jgi:Icc-related predicted phosphoesterase
VKLLAFSDLHRDLEQGKRVAELAAAVDVVVGAGDFASVHRGLEETIAVLRPIERPTVLVPGNNETDEALCAACQEWEAVSVLHGNGTVIDGMPFFGLGAGVPTTPWDWSFDLTEEEAAQRLSACPEGCVLVVHSPPKGHVDLTAAGQHLGSAAVLAAIEAKRPRVALCGHIHESWGRESRLGETRILNLGPAGVVLEV